jgi:hypothetical protein
MERSYERRATHRKKGNFGELISEMVEVNQESSGIYRSEVKAIVNK